jgi:predicted DNA-binding transcriptional regulator AlpA
MRCRAIHREAIKVHDDKAVDELLGDNALAERMGVSATHVWHLAARRVIPRPYKLGRVARWRWPEVLAALKQTRTGPDEGEVLRLTEAREKARARKQTTGAGT